MFDFELPQERIALRPASPRDSARMMVVHRDGRIVHRHVRDLPEYLGPGDALVVNDTRVIPARLHGVGLRAAGIGETDIFITPGYRFRAADLLLTNFHLPRSTLFMLVCALMGLEVMKRAYAEAIAQGYRFYSYGDACLLMPAR